MWASALVQMFFVTAILYAKFTSANPLRIAGPISVGRMRMSANNMCLANESALADASRIVAFSGQGVHQKIYTECLNVLHKNATRTPSGQAGSGRHTCHLRGAVVVVLLPHVEACFSGLAC